MMVWLNRFADINWRFLGAAFCAAAILHIILTLAAPEIAAAPPYTRLRAILPANKMIVLPPITADTQPLPFMSPDARYAMCRFDSTKGPVTITASLPGPGWTLSLHSREGENFYTAVAQPGRTSNVSLVLIPTDERFTGLTPEAKGRSIAVDSALTLVAPNGIAIVRAPDTGLSFRAINEAELARAKCEERRG